MPATQCATLPPGAALKKAPKISGKVPSLAIKHRRSSSDGQSRKKRKGIFAPAKEEGEAKFGFASAIPAFLPKQGEDFIQGPATALNPSGTSAHACRNHRLCVTVGTACLAGVYHRRDAGYDNLFQKVNTKAIMMGKWQGNVPPTPQGNRGRDPHRPRGRRTKPPPKTGGVVTNGSEIMLDQDWIFLTVSPDNDVVVQQNGDVDRRTRRAVFKVHLLLTETQKSGGKLDKTQRLMARCVSGGRGGLGCSVTWRVFVPQSTAAVADV